MGLGDLPSRVGLLAIALTACSSDPSEPRGSARSAIKGGASAPDDTAVVGIFDSSTSGTCTGALVAPNLVLTAQHCVAPVLGVPTCARGSFGAPGSPDQFFATTKPTMSLSPSDYHGVVEIAVPPGSEFCGRDVALLFLGAPVDASEASPLVPRVDLAAAAGETYSAVGFGGIDDFGAASGERRRRDGLTIACAGTDCAPATIAASEWTGEAGVCPGDSGGPALDAVERVIGVASRGVVGCVDPTYGDVAANAEWLSAQAKHAADLGGYEPPPWSSGEPTAPGDEPLPIGAACTTDQECESMLCVDGACASSTGEGGSGAGGGGGETAEPDADPKTASAPESEGGCSVLSKHSPRSSILELALLASTLCLRRRRRAAC